MDSSPSSSPFQVPVVPQILTFLFFLLSNGASGTTLTFVNNCGFTIWPATTTTIGTPLSSYGFELREGNLRSFQVSDGWAGRFWGRTGCDFTRPGNGSCVSGDCGTGEMECNGNLYTPPATLVEFRINQARGQDFYDVSLVNGFNIPIQVEPTGSCPKAGCVDDLNRLCPVELKSEGGCRGPCQVFGTDEYCCSKSFASPSTCKPTTYSRFFKSACPRAYSTPYDDQNSLFTCKGADYTIRFCPAAHSFSTIKVRSQLNSTDQLVSIRGNFKLGFFFVEDYGYLGIWYTSDVQSRKVWVASPDTPIVGTSGTLALSIDPTTGNLVITNGVTILMTITGVQGGPYPNVTATLEDNGNFRLTNEIDKRVLWQSFDHPTNVLLPGMKLGKDMKTGQNWTLTSWLSDDIPTSGAFVLSWEPQKEGLAEALSYLPPLLQPTTSNSS